MIWVIIDYRKNNIELRRCPKCNETIKQKFTLKFFNRYISRPSDHGANLVAQIYTCQKCGNSWNYTYEYDETSST